MYKHVLCDFEGETLSIREYFIKGNNHCLFVFVHGADNSHQAMLAPICCFLKNKGINCLSFDFSGHGDSSSRTQSSIRKKSLELAFVLEKYARCCKELVIFSFSMGGQIVLNSLKTSHKPKGLVFFKPALYCTNSFDIPFGEAFTKAIRQEASFKNNNAAAALQHFTGAVLMFRSEFDFVIPDEVFNSYKLAAAHLDFTQVLLPGAPHALGAWFSSDIARFSKVYDVIANKFF